MAISYQLFNYIMPARRFPPPWYVEEQPARLLRDHNGHCHQHRQVAGPFAATTECETRQNKYLSGTELTGP